MNKNPIGIFDSGLGGLTVAKAISEQLPYETIVYFGDTAHTPWGDKSIKAIQHYAEKICNVLINEMDCKAIIIACNTASAVAMDVIKKYTKNKAVLINVIDPVVENITNNFNNSNIGLIGTKQTIKSQAYQTRITTINPTLNTKALATPLLVPLIEEGFTNKEATKLILKDYLNNVAIKDINALILGCTHYPILKQMIESHYQNSIQIIDSAHLTAIKTYEMLNNSNLLANKKITNNKFYITDYNDFFAQTAKRFLNTIDKISYYSMWENEIHENFL